VTSPGELHQEETSPLALGVQLPNQAVAARASRVPVRVERALEGSSASEPDTKNGVAREWLNGALLLHSSTL
jgi:hypothetical protein